MTCRSGGVKDFQGNIICNHEKPFEQLINFLLHISKNLLNFVIRYICIAQKIIISLVGTFINLYGYCKIKF